MQTIDTEYGIIHLKHILGFADAGKTYQLFWRGSYDPYEYFDPFCKQIYRDEKC